MIHRTVGSKDRRVHWDANHMGRGLYIAQITLIIYYQIELDKLNLYETLMCSIPKMCWWLCIPSLQIFDQPINLCLKLLLLGQVDIVRLIWFYRPLQHM
jgi:hypothetical protein